MASFAPGATDTFSFYWSIAAPPPANDAFGHPQILTGASGSVAETNLGATKQAAEPNHAGNPGGASVWSQWTATGAGQVTIDTFGSGFDTTLAVYKGSSMATLTPVVSNDDAAGTVQSRVSFVVVPGQTYRIAVDGFNDTVDGAGNPVAVAAATGPITLRWALITIVTVTAKTNPSTFGQAVALTATVVDPNIPLTSLTGTMTFYDGSTLLGTATVKSGKALLTTAKLGAGDHDITASYLRLPTDVPIRSGPLAQHVNQAKTTLAFTLPPLQSAFGQKVTFTATAKSVLPGKGVPSGTVSLFVDGNLTPLATIPLTALGKASFSMTSLAVGPHSLGAVFNGSANFIAATAPSIAETVLAATTKTTLVVSPLTSSHGAPVTLTATVKAVAPGAGVPSGSVTFTDGTTVLATVSVDITGKAILVTSTLTVGNHPITATYGEVGGYLASTSTTITAAIH